MWESVIGWASVFGVRWHALCDLVSLSVGNAENGSAGKNVGSVGNVVGDVGSVVNVGSSGSAWLGTQDVGRVVGEGKNVGNSRWRDVNGSIGKVELDWGFGSAVGSGEMLEGVAVLETVEFGIEVFEDLVWVAGGNWCEAAERQ